MKYNKTKTNFGILLMLIIISVAVVPSVAAQEVTGCCIETTNSKFCVDSMTASAAATQCDIGQFRTGAVCSDLDECTSGTCLPPTGPCQGNTLRADCGPGWDSRPISQIAECQEGCCSVLGKQCSIKQEKLCTEWALNYGFKAEDVFFDVNIINDNQCRTEVCDKEAKGCCEQPAETASGTCIYTTRQDCTLKAGKEFYDNKYCKDVTACAVQPHYKQKCISESLDPTKGNLCWFGLGVGGVEQQEECDESCDYPSARCWECDKTNCTDDIRTTNGNPVVVGMGQPYCKTRSCVFTTLNDSQQINNVTGNLEWVTGAKKKLLAGQSICYNFFSAMGDARLQETSIGLQNQYLECQEALAPEPAIRALGIDRNIICKDNPSSMQVTTIANNWQNCSSCGLSTAGLDFLGDYFSLGMTSLQLVSNAAGDHCTKDLCESSGDCVYHVDWAPSGLAKKVGSCDPKYSPGITDKCTECGKGADGFWQPCSKDECYSLGNCNFKPDAIGRKAAYSSLYTAGIAYLERVDLVPIDSLVSAMAYPIVQGGCVGTDPVTYIPCVLKQYPAWMLKRYDAYLIKGMQFVFKTVAKDIPGWFFSCFKPGGCVSIGADPIKGGYFKDSTDLKQKSDDATKSATELNDLRAKWDNAGDAEKKTIGEQIKTKFGTIDTKELDKKAAELKMQAETLKTQADEKFKELKEGKKKADALKANDAKKKPTDWVNIIAWGISWVYGGVGGLTLGNALGTCTSDEVQQDLCASCNADPHLICTAERCLQLGSNCRPWADQDKRKDGNFICYKEPCEGVLTAVKSIKTEWFVDNADSAGTTEASAETGKDYTELNATVPWNASDVKLTITTDQRAWCRWTDKAGQDFSAMNEFGTPKFSGTEYEVDIPFCTGEGSAIKCYQPGNTQTIYIKCSNLCNMTHSNEFDYNFVRFKVGEMPDFVAPGIDFVDPGNNAWLPDTWSQLTVEFWLSENGPASIVGGYHDVCRFSDAASNWTENWTEMTPFQDGTGFGYPFNSSVISGTCFNNKACKKFSANDCAKCSLTLNLKKGYQEFDWENLRAQTASMDCSQLSGDDLEACENAKQQAAGSGQIFRGKTKLFSFIIKCQDENYNKMDSYTYSLVVAPPYNLTISSPAADERTYVKKPAIEVATTQPTQCKYSIDSNKDWDEKKFIDTAFVEKHSGQIIENLSNSAEGIMHKLYVSCRGYGDLPVDKDVTFYALKDTKAPVIIRAYHDAGLLKIVTDEKSTCSYNFYSAKGCNFNLEKEGILMTGDDSTQHFESWSADKTYYIKCKDEDGNVPAGCSAIIKPMPL